MLGHVTGICVTSDNKYVVTCSRDKSLKLFKFPSMEQVQHLQNCHAGF